MIRYYSRSKTQTINIILSTHVPSSASLLCTDVNSNNDENFLCFMVRVVQDDRFIIVRAIYHFRMFFKKNFKSHLSAIITLFEKRAAAQRQILQGFVLPFRMYFFPSERFTSREPRVCEREQRFLISLNYSKVEVPEEWSLNYL